MKSFRQHISQFPENTVAGYRLSMMNMARSFVGEEPLTSTNADSVFMLVFITNMDAIDDGKTSVADIMAIPFPASSPNRVSEVPDLKSVYMKLAGDFDSQPFVRDHGEAVLICSFLYQGVFSRSSQMKHRHRGSGKIVNGESGTQCQILFADYEHANIIVNEHGQVVDAISTAPAGDMVNVAKSMRIDEINLEGIAVNEIAMQRADDTNFWMNMIIERVVATPENVEMFPTS